MNTDQRGKVSFLTGGIVVCILTLTLASGFANLKVWAEIGNSETKYVYIALGVVCEAWGLLGLLVFADRVVDKSYLKAVIALMLWIVAVLVNGYSNYRLLEGDGKEHSQSNLVEKQKYDNAVATLDELLAKREKRIEGRSIAAIQKDLEGRPDNHLTIRAELTAELEEAKLTQSLEEKIKDKRNQLTKLVAATDAQGQSALTSSWLSVALVAWIEAIKALGLWLLRRNHKTSEITPTQPVLPNQRRVKDARGRSIVQRML